MFLNDFFWIKESSRTDNDLTFKLEIGPGHKMFEGHFPGMPVVPGVVMLQMIAESLSHSLKFPLVMIGCTNVKFLIPFLPNEHKVVELRISYTESESNFEVNGTLAGGSQIFLKLIKGIFKRHDGSKLSQGIVLP